MTLFMASLAGIPPLAGWFAKFVMFRSIIDAGTGWGIALAVIAAVNSVIAFFYYFRVVVQMWFASPPRPTIARRSACRQPLAGRDRVHWARSCVVIGIYPQIVRTDRGASRSEPERPPTRSRSLIRREGPITFDRFMEAALYERGRLLRVRARRGPRRARLRHEPGGRLAVRRVRRARARPVLARRSSEPDPFLVVEAGAGNGRLARDVLRAAARVRAARCATCSSSGRPRSAPSNATRLALEPADEALGPFVRRRRRRRAGPGAGRGAGVRRARRAARARSRRGVVIANELLDNLPFGIARVGRRRAGSRCASRSTGGRFAEVLVPDRDADARAVERSPAGTRVPIPRGIARLVRARATGSLRHGIVVLDRLHRRRAPRLARPAVVAHVSRPRARRRRRSTRRARRTSPPTSCSNSSSRRARRLPRRRATDAGGMAARPRHRRARRAGAATWEEGARTRRPRRARRPQPRRRSRRAHRPGRPRRPPGRRARR